MEHSSIQNTRRKNNSSSRIVPPQRRGRLCQRQELLESLDESLRARVTLIVAPAGYGKTTLLSQWCERLISKQTPVAYYAASERDCIPTVFLTMIASALSEAEIDSTDQADAFDKIDRDEITLDDILLSLELSGQQLALIIDDYERINDAAVNQILTELINAAPPTLHLVIASRTFPAIPLSTIELEGGLRLIDAYQLRLRQDELAWFLEIDPDTPEISEIATRTQGWPVTAELYRLWRQRRQAYDPRATFGGHVAEVHNYLTEQLFSSLPKEEYDLLVDIADRDEVCAELADAMRERTDSAHLLQAASHSISSLMWADNEHGVIQYRLHPLLLEHLRQNLEQNVARREQLATRAARWYLEKQQFPEALKTAIESQNKATITDVIRQLRPIHIMIASSATRLRVILREASEELIAKHPRLQVMLAIAHFKAGFFAESRKMLEKIRQATNDFTHDSDGHHEWLSIEGNFIDLVFFCQVSRMSTRVEELRDIVMAAATDDPTIWGACENVMMLAHQIRGDFDAADAAIQKARQLYDTVEPSHYSNTQITGHEVLVLIGRGKLSAASELITHYQKHPDLDFPDDTSTPTLLKLIHGAIRYEQEFSNLAVEAIRENFAEHSKTESWFDQYAIAFPSIAMWIFLSDGPAAALAYIADIRERAHRSDIEALPDFLTFLEIDFSARGQDLQHAERLAQRVDLKGCADATDRLAKIRGWREKDTATRAMIRLCFAQNENEGALEYAVALAKAGEQGQRLGTEIRGHVLSALAFQKLGNANQACLSLHRAILLAYPEGFVAPFAEDGSELTPLIEMLAADEQMDAFAKRHLDTIHRAINSAMSKQHRDELNAREQEVVGYLVEGMSNKLIAREMGISHHTVKFHLKKVFSKLKVSSRRAAVAKVMAGEIELD